MTSLAQLSAQGVYVSPKLVEEVFLDSIVASAMLEQSLGTPAQIRAACQYLIEQGDEHDDCTLTACLNPLHPGPCKGWKHTLHQVSPEAWHALEAARVEKANKKRLAKIEELKAKNLPIPKKLLVEIKPKAAPTAPLASEVGKTAAKAGGEAHAAGKAVSEAAGVVPKHAGTPGKVTLGQAVKAPLGPKGKKPTLASKGIAFVISQEKVTDAYKLDKASKITPEQWASLSHADQGIVRAELKKIQENGFGPQKDKATELLDKLPHGKPSAPEVKHVTTPFGHKIQDVTPAKEPKTVTTPSGKKIQDVSATQKTEPPKPKTPELAKTGGPAAKAQPTPGYREPKKLSEVATPTTVVKTFEPPAGKKTGTLTDQALFPEKYYNDAQQGAVHALGEPDVSKKLAAYKMSASSFQGLTPEHQKAIAADLDKIATTHHDPHEAAQAQLLADAYHGDAAKLSKPQLTAIAVASHLMGQNKTVDERAKALNTINAQEFQQLKKPYQDVIAAEHAKLSQELAGMPAETDLSKKIKGEAETALSNLGQKMNGEVPTPAVKENDHPLLGKKVTAQTLLSGKPVTGVLVHHSTKTETSGPMAGQPLTIAHVKGDNGSLHIVNPGSIKKAGEEPKKISPTVPEDAPKHIQDAVAMAKGLAPGASWSKNQLPVYQKLSKQEYDALPPLIKDKINLDLQKALTKFLDPKKKAATQELIDKFKGAPEVKAEKPKIENVSIGTHFNSHDVTPEQAKAAVAEASPGELQAATFKLTGLAPYDHPDASVHEKLATEQAQNSVAALLPTMSDKAIADPQVQAAMKSYRQAVHDQTYAQSVGNAKKKTFHAVSGELAHDKGNLTPIQRAVLEQQYQHVTNHPVDTTQVHIGALQSDANTKLLAVQHAIQQAKKGEASPHVSDMTPAQLTSKASDLMGPSATQPDVHLSAADLKFVNEVADGKSATHINAVPEELKSEPQVASAIVGLKQAQRSLSQNEAMLSKLQSHLEAHHNKTLATGFDKSGKPLTEADRAVIQAHAKQLQDNYKHYANYAQQYKTELESRITGLQKAVQNAKDQKAAIEAQAAGGKLTEFDTQTINDAYNKAWRNAAYEATFYGAKSNWSKKQAIKNHPEFEAFNQNYKDLGDAAGKLAVTHAHAHQALLAVPTDDNGHPLTDTPEWKAYQDANKAAKSAQAEFDARHKVAQDRLDTIRTAAGLKKRSLPKLDAAAVKTAAAESGYFKSGGFGGPNHGKNASAKQYMVAKVGPKFAVAHKDYTDKYTEKQEKAQEKQAKLAEQHKDFYQAQAASKEANKGKYALPPHLNSTENQQTPNPAVAEHFGFHLEKQVQESGVHGWEAGVGPAYVRSPEDVAMLREHLAKPDTKFGMEAQKSFEWSINNMTDKGSDVVGIGGYRTALYNYTGSGYQGVNEALNSAPPGAKISNSNVTRIDKGMAASPPLQHDVVLYRGFKDPHFVFGKSGKWNDTNVAGMEWTQRSYSSTSGSLGTAKAFGSGGVVMRIIIPKEMNVHGINAKGGQHPGENEIILQRGLRYRVVADYGRHGHYNARYIDVMVVPDPHAKPEQ